MVPIKGLIYKLEGLSLMLYLMSGPPGFNCLISFATVFSCMYC